MSIILNFLPQQYLNARLIGSLSIDLWTEEIFIQKLNYIPVRTAWPGGHNNPINHPWNLVQYAEDYKYSSAKFYEAGIDEFGLLTHYRD